MVSRYANQTYYSLIRHTSVCNTFQKPSITSIIDVKKTTTWGESGFPSEFLGSQAKPVFVVAQSLGAQQISNYVWDADKNLRFFADQGEGDEAMRKFRRLNTCKQFITTGCNIPLFKAGLPYPENFKRPNEEFIWHNYFDRDDVLGYPIKRMAPSFNVDWVRDHKVSVGGIFSGWNPFSHTRYWTDRDVLNPIANNIKAILA